MCKPIKNISRRSGATAVEFAMVAPVVFLLVFCIFEIAQLVMFGGNVNTAMLTGMRRATLSDSTTTEVIDVINEELGRFGITEANIKVTLPDVSTTDHIAKIEVDVPIATSFGLQLTEISKSVSFSRE